jgi:hypothetical protein
VGSQARARRNGQAARRSVTQALLVTLWKRSLDAATAAADAAFAVKAFDEVQLKCAEQHLRQEREWLRRFERDSDKWFS